MIEQAPRLEDLLTVGRKVRVRLSPECIPQAKPTSDAARAGHPEHTPSLDGRIGVIKRTDYPELPNHPYEVAFPGGFVAHGIRYLAEPYAPSELIPLSDDGTEIEHPALARFER